MKYSTDNLVFRSSSHQCQHDNQPAQMVAHFLSIVVNSTLQGVAIMRPQFRCQVTDVAHANLACIANIGSIQPRHAFVAFLTGLAVFVSGGASEGQTLAPAVRSAVVDPSTFGGEPVVPAIVRKDSLTASDRVAPVSGHGSLSSSAPSLDLGPSSEGKLLKINGEEDRIVSTSDTPPSGFPTATSNNQPTRNRSKPSPLACGRRDFYRASMLAQVFGVVAIQFFTLTTRQAFHARSVA